MKQTLLLFIVGILYLPQTLQGRGDIIENTSLPAFKKKDVSLPVKQLSAGQVISGKPQALYFIENKGQITDQYGKVRKDIQYKLSGGGVSVFVGNGELHYEGMSPSSEVSTYRMDVVLAGADRHAKVVAEEEQGYYERYYMGDLQKNRDGIIAHSYKKITYKDVYPHIDWVLYVKEGHMEYDFVVRPGGKVSDIKLRYKGATDMRQNADGSITSRTPMGSISEQKPVSYEQGTGRQIASSFQLKKHSLSFRLNENYDPKSTIVIDPALIWATYYGYNASTYWNIGGSADVNPCNVVCDAAGNAYINGYTNSITNIATSGAYENTLQGTNGCGFLSAFSPSGNLLWGSYFNVDNSGDYPSGLACDPTGYLYIAGSVNSTSNNISTVSAYKDTISGQTDAYLAKFTTTGALQWCTYYGGELDEAANAVACDGSGNIYMAGVTTSTTGIATNGAYQPSLANGGDAFLVKFSGNGSLLWATYFGGQGGDGGSGLACDPSGNVYLCGQTESNSGIASPNGFKSTYDPAEGADVFLTKFNSSGAFQWGTYYGGLGEDIVYGIACDPLGNVYIDGGTESDTGIASTGSYQSNYNYSADGFLVKFDGNGNRLWGSYYGGSGSDGLIRVACNSKGEIYVCGTTNSANGIASPNATQASIEGGWDGFWVKFSADGNRLFSTYLGGTGTDDGWGIACHDSSSIYVVGYSRSSSGLATNGAYQTNLGGFVSPFLAHYNNDSLYLVNPFPDTLLCQGDTFEVAYYTDEVDFANGNIFTAQLSDANGSFANPVNIGSLAAVSTDSILCVLPLSTAPGTHYRIRVMASSPMDSSVADNRDIVVKASPQFTTSANSPVCTGDSIKLSITSSTVNTYAWTGPASFSSTAQNPYRTNAAYADSGDYVVKASLNGCSLNDTVHVSVHLTPAIPTAGSNSPLCAGNELDLQSGSSTAGVSYSWTGPDGYVSALQNPVISSAGVNQSGSYTVTATLNGCSSSAATTATVNANNPAPTINISVSPSDTICGDATITFTATISNGGSSPIYQWRKNGMDIAGANAASYTETGLLGDNDKVSCLVTANELCQAIDTAASNEIKMHTVIYPMPGISVTEYPAVFMEGDTATFTAIVTNGSPVGLNFQWLKNGQPIPGATSSSYSSATLMKGDVINLFVSSSIPCVVPDTLLTNSISLDVKNVGNVANAAMWKVYPNPNKGTFTITSAKGGEVFIINMMGQVVYRDKLVPDKQIITLDVPSGVYMVELVGDDGGKRVQRLVVNPQSP